MGRYSKTFTINYGETVVINLNDIYQYYGVVPPNTVVTPIDEYGMVSRLFPIGAQLPLTKVTVANTSNPNYAFITSGYSGSAEIVDEQWTVTGSAYGTFSYSLSSIVLYYNGSYYERDTETSIIYFVIPSPNTPQPPSPVIPQGTKYNPLSRYCSIEKNKTTTLNLSDFYINGEQIKFTNLEDLPAWITRTTSGEYTTQLTCSPTSLSYGGYSIDVFSGNSFQGSANFFINVVDSLFEEIDNCCKDEDINIVWINRQGGRSNFIFTQRKDFSIEVGKKSTFITGEIKKYSQIKEVYNQTTVYAKGISLNALNYLDGLRYSIQSWVYNNGSFIPILLDVKSFEKYNTKENMYDVQITFTYANDLNIQTQ